MYSVYNPEHNKKWENLHMFPFGNVDDYLVLKRYMTLSKNIGGGVCICFTEDRFILLYEIELMSNETKKFIIEHEKAHLSLKHYLDPTFNQNNELEADTLAASKVNKSEIKALIAYLKQVRMKLWSLLTIVPFFQYTQRIRNLKRILKTK